METNVYAKLWDQEEYSGCRYKEQRYTEPQEIFRGQVQMDLLNFGYEQLRRVKDTSRVISLDPGGIVVKIIT